MTLLKSFDAYNLYFDVDSKSIIESVSVVRYFGWYKVVNDLLTGLLVKSRKLYFLYGTSEILVSDQFHSEIKHNDESNSTLELYEGSELICKLTYQTDNFLHGIAPFEYIDEEDFDWGLYISNTINNPETRSNLIDNLSLGHI